MGLGLGNPVHLAILVLIIVLLFGARRLPELGRSLGTGIREFKDSISGRSEEDADRLAQADSEKRPVDSEPAQADPSVARETSPPSRRS